MRKITARNMTGRTGLPIPNQIIVTTEEGELFISYKTAIAMKHKKGFVLLDEKAWNYSRTTAKYRRQFLNESTLETKKKIESNIHCLVDLNE